MKDKIFFI